MCGLLLLNFMRYCIKTLIEALKHRIKQMHLPELCENCSSVSKISSFCRAIAWGDSVCRMYSNAFVYHSLQIYKSAKKNNNQLSLFFVVVTFET